MSAPLESYLKTYRRRSGFSQNEIAFLLGCKNGAKVSRYEHCVRRPTLKTALACEVILRVPASELFAGLYRKVEKETATRALMLAKQFVAANPSRVTLRKLAILHAISSGRPVPHAKR